MTLGTLLFKLQFWLYFKFVVLMCCLNCPVAVDFYTCPEKAKRDYETANHDWFPSILPRHQKRRSNFFKLQSISVLAMHYSTATFLKTVPQLLGFY